MDWENISVESRRGALGEMKDNVSAESDPLGGLSSHAAARWPLRNQRVTNRRSLNMSHRFGVETSKKGEPGGS